MLSHKEADVALFADPLDGLEDDVDQHWRQTRQRAGWKEVIEIVDSSLGNGRKSSWEQVIGRAD